MNTILMVVPRRTGSTSAEISLAGFGGCPDQPTTVRVSPVTGGPSLTVVVPRAWNRLAGGSAAPIYHHTVDVDGLTPGTIYRALLVDAFDRELARGAFETLPTRLPATGDGSGPHRPFTVWSSSCFHSPSASPHIERMVHALMDDPRYRPHAKFLLGDQVYLDRPLPWTVFSPGQDALRARFNEAYTNNWTHPGFRALLSGSATFFMSDDHEFWNNYPEPAVPLLSAVRLPGFWEAWDRLARERFVALQGGRRVETFDIARADGQGRGLSFFLADTRIDRTREGARLMSEESMDQLAAWLRNLDCPGVLAMGQPLLAFPGVDADWHLPAYRQYRKEVVPAIDDCRHDLLVLVGDSHFGRVAVTSSRHRPEPRKIVEIVSSPLALVSPLAGHGADKSLHKFPWFEDDRGRCAIEYPREVPTYIGPQGQTLSEEHGMTVSFWSTSGGVGLRVRPWFVREATQKVSWVWETELA